MTADFTAVVVAVVSVAGTLGGATLAQRTSLRQKEIEAKTQRLAAAEEREAAAHAANLAERKDLCAEMNMSAHAYRARCNDVVRSLEGYQLPFPSNEPSLRDEAKSARVAFRVAYSHAQMMLSERTLQYVEVIAQCLGHAYGLMIESSIEHTSVAIEWINGPCVDGLSLLRSALREELGIDEQSAALNTAVEALERVHDATHVAGPR
jgi:hypothetical protein